MAAYHVGAVKAPEKLLLRRYFWNKFLGSLLNLLLCMGGLGFITEAGTAGEAVAAGAWVKAPNVAIANAV
jgi:hypothetical protein